MQNMNEFSMNEALYISVFKNFLKRKVHGMWLVGIVNKIKIEKHKIERKKQSRTILAVK